MFCIPVVVCALCSACFDFSDGYMGTCGNGFVDDDEECDSGSENSDVDADACRSSCTFASCGDGVIDEGEDCDRTDAECVACQEVQAGTEGPSDEGRADGDACSADSECSSGFCTDGACCPSRCADTCRECSRGSCAEVRNAPDPDTCSSCFGDATCAGRGVLEACENGSECSTGICVNDTCRRRDASTCSANAECENNACIGGQCTSPAAILAACDDSDDCQGNLVCPSGFCLVPDGSACADDSQCVNLCIFSTCQAPGDVEANCEDDDDCAGELICHEKSSVLACRIPTGGSTQCNDNDLICEQACVDGQCQEYLNSGDSCLRESQCAPLDTCCNTCRDPGNSPC